MRRDSTSKNARDQKDTRAESDHLWQSSVENIRSLMKRTEVLTPRFGLTFHYVFLAVKILKEHPIETFASFCKMEEAEALDRFGEIDCRALMACSL